MVAWILLLGAICCEVAGTLSLRASDGFSRWQWTIPMAIGYVVSFTLLGLVLKHGIPVGVAYGVWSGIGVASTAVLARFLFNDAFTPTMALGVVLIGAGVYLMEIGGHR